MVHRARPKYRRRRLAETFRQRQSGCAKPAFGERPADIPVRATASGAMVDLIFAIDDAIAAVRRIVGEAFAGILDD